MDDMVLARFFVNIRLLLFLLSCSISHAERLRLVIETDAGGDPDDEQSLVRFLLYANEWDVEGIIANRPTAREGENLNTERTGLGIVRGLLAAYGQCSTNLMRNDPRYPSKEILWQRTVAGYNTTEDAVNLIISVVDRPDARPVWYSDWGTDNGAATNNLKRALDRVLRERGLDEYAKFKSKLRLSSYDRFGEHTTSLPPAFSIWINTFQPPMDGKRWYHRFSAITAKAGGFDLERHVLRDHGPLGALYPTNTTHWQKEGDTMTFLYLVPTGMNDPTQPAWGSWAGRYGQNENYSGKPYYWANQVDAWRGSTNRDNTLARWATVLQNDFRARLDWCVKAPAQANHPPLARIAGPNARKVQAGSRIELNAEGSSDPDGDALSFHWECYPEPGSYRGELEIENADRANATLVVPAVQKEETIHLILTATDNGTPPLSRYQRVILTVTPPSRKESFQWRRATPEREGFSGAALDKLRDRLASNSTAFIVIRNEQLLHEWYAPGYSFTKPHYTASMAKALVGGISTALLLDDRLIKLDKQASTLIPGWTDNRSTITVRQLGSHTSGLMDAEENNLPHEKLPGWKGDFWKRLPPPRDPFTISRTQTPMQSEPGKAFHYSNPGMAMLAYALTSALKNAPQRDLRTLLRERVMQPAGVPDNEWSAGYGETVQVDGLPLVATWGGGSYSPRALATIGRLMLHNGNWSGKQLISPDAIEQTTRDAKTPGFCGIGWWSNNDGFCEKLPRDAFWAGGAGHQVLLVIPSLDLIVIRNGESLAPKLNYDEALRREFFEPLADALLSSAETPPCPWSSAIRQIVWVPEQTIRRKARGSDNWPLTWADDDDLYTAYGDGNGFEPFVKEKLSLGLAKIGGVPPDFKGINLSSASLEKKGDGPKGKKASGILMIDGVLYLWLRNAGNSQLAWSADHGANWTWSPWKFTESFGCPTFLNFGKNYQGARDAFVYVYSPDSNSAYDAADSFVLARVPKEKVREREAYEFFRERNGQGDPIWTPDISARGSIFRSPGRCYRSGVSYNPALRRYIWCQTLPGGDARFAGGFGIFDAPEPWGPWTTVFYTQKWDVGPGESSSFPTKWMRTDGKGMWLVFSGGDSFSAREAALFTE